MKSPAVEQKWQEPQQQSLNIPMDNSSLEVQQQWQQSEIHEKEMKVIDKVMETLNSVVNQLDNMNNTMKLLEQRIDNVEMTYKLK